MVGGEVFGVGTNATPRNTVLVPDVARVVTVTVVPVSVRDTGRLTLAPPEVVPYSVPSAPMVRPRRPASAFPEAAISAVYCRVQVPPLCVHFWMPPLEAVPVPVVR